MAPEYRQARLGTFNHEHTKDTKKQGRQSIRRTIKNLCILISFVFSRFVVKENFTTNPILTAFYRGRKPTP